MRNTKNWLNEEYLIHMTKVRVIHEGHHHRTEYSTVEKSTLSVFRPSLTSHLPNSAVLYLTAPLKRSTTLFSLLSWLVQGGALKSKSMSHPEIFSLNINWSTSNWVGATNHWSICLVSIPVPLPYSSEFSSLTSPIALPSLSLPWIVFFLYPVPHYGLSFLSLVHSSAQIQKPRTFKHKRNSYPNSGDPNHTLEKYKIYCVFVYTWFCSAPIATVSTFLERIPHYRGEI